MCKDGGDDDEVKLTFCRCFPPAVVVCCGSAPPPLLVLRSLDHSTNCPHLFIQWLP